MRTKVSVGGSAWPASTLKLLLCGAALACGPATAGAAGAAPLVQTQEGPVEGIEKDGVRAFTAIPFAAAPVGDLRFRAPQPRPKWTAPLVANKELPIYVQFGGRDNPAQTEDCLYLSVWLPAGATPNKPVPVMVWIYGGGAITGSARNFDGSSLAKNGGVAVVTLNYRLGILATMVDKSLDEPGVLSGNMATRDQQAALRWVQRNIAAFGGDPKNVTLFGQSSGAGGVLRNVVSPEAKGLFQKAIAMSSTDAGGIATKRQTVESGPSKAVIKSVGCEGKPDVAACLRAAPATVFTAAAAALPAPYRYSVLDDKLIPVDVHEAFQTGKFNRIPMIVGSNLTEAVVYVLPIERRMGRALRAEDLAAAGKELMGGKAEGVLKSYDVAKFPAPDHLLMQAVTDWRHACPNELIRRSISAYVPLYAIENAVPNSSQMPPDPAVSQLPNTPRHGSENPYIWGSRTGFNPQEVLISARMQAYWSNFAKSSKPEPTGHEWPVYTAGNPQLLSLKETPILVTDFAQRHNCAYLEANKLFNDGALSD